MIPTKKQLYQEKQGLIERILAQRNLTVRIIAELRDKLSCTITFADMPREDVEAVAAQFRDKGWSVDTFGKGIMVK